MSHSAMMIFGYVFNVGVALLANALSKPKASQQKANDYLPTTLATQGSYVPLLIGKRRVGAVFAWAGDRFSQSASTGSGGGKGSRRRRAPPGPQVWYESGWHLLCVGPAKALTKIWADGKVIWEGSINVDDDPSGTTVQLTNGDEFVIYWGEEDQPINTFLGGTGRVGAPDASSAGISSRWPFVCYVQWTKKLLGEAPRWPQLEYELECEANFDELDAGDSYITGPPTGVNPAAALSQLLSATYPHGAGQFDEEWDTGAGGSFEDFADEVNTCGQWQPCSILAADGTEATDPIGALMQDYGLFLSWDVQAGTWTLKRIRQPSLIEEVPGAARFNVPEVEVVHAPAPADRLLFSFADASRQYRESTVGIAENGQATLLQIQRSRVVPMPTVIDYEVAAYLATRRSQEELAGNVGYKLVAGRDARRLLPGDTIVSDAFVDANDYTPVLRVVEVEIDTNTSEVVLSCVPDHYGVETLVAEGDGDAGGTGGTGGGTPAAEDEAFTFLEVPAHLLAGAAPSIVVPRLRATLAEIFADLHLSDDGTTYHVGDREPNLCSGGELLDALPASDDWIIAQGPTFTALGPDIAEIEDLSSDLPAWRRGRQLCVIGEEIFYLQKVTHISGSTYRLDGLMRARYDTDRATHAIGDVAYIFRFEAITDVADPALLPGVSLRVKSQPFTSGDAVSLASISPVTKTLYGKGITPPPPCALRVSAPRPGSASYRTGEDVTFAWASRIASPTSAGIGLHGIGTLPVGAGALPPDTTFEVRVYDALDALVRTEPLGAVTTWTYDNADLVSDLGGETDFSIEVVQLAAGVRSSATSLAVVAI